MTAPRPNVLLVVFDTARRDVWEPYGAPAGSTPALAQLAATGTAHQAMYAPASWTVPSHGALFCGTLPRSAGLRHEGGGVPATFRAALEAQGDRVLAEVLRRAGWATSGISANHWVHAYSGFSRGFERWASIPHPRHNGLGPDIGWAARARWYLSALRAHLDDGAAAVEAQLEVWLRERDHRPALWFVNLVECHSPYLPPLPYTPLGPIGRLRAAGDARRHQTLEGFWRASLQGWSGSAGALARMQVQYRAAIALLDSWLARVLELLDRHGVLQETQVIVTSDHGENLGEGGLLGHAFSLDDRLLRVPFVTAGPLRLELPPVAGLHDVAGALGDALGLAKHPWVERPVEPTVAVAQLDGLGRRGDERTEGLIERWALDERGVERLCASFTAATDGRWKLLRRSDGAETSVDLDADPLELSPSPVEQVGVPPETLARLRRVLDAAAASEQDLAAPATATAPADAEVADLEDRMRLLGYM